MQGQGAQQSDVTTEVQIVHFAAASMLQEVGGVVWASSAVVVTAAAL